MAERTRNAVSSERRVAMIKSCFLCLALCFAGTPAQAQANPVPFLNQTLLPSSTAPGGPGLTLTVTGTGLASASVVDWNGTSLPTAFVSDTQLTATIPATNIAIASTASIIVSTPQPGGGVSNVVFFTVSPQTTPSFTQYVQSGPPSPLGQELQAPVAVDVNADGKLDIVAGWAGELLVMLGQGDGSFQPAAVSQLVGNTNAQTASTSVGDFNGDGKLDFALSYGTTLNNAVQSTVEVVLGNGDGTFGTPSSVPLASGYAVNYTAVGDFNQDGKLDLITGNNPAITLANPTGRGNSTVSILLGNGDGTFQAHVDYELDSQVTSLAVGDVNGDGKLDVVVGGHAVLLGNGDGTFASPSLTGSVYTFDQIALQDVNGDGKLDLLGVDGNGGLVVSLGNGDGTFIQGVAYNLPNGTQVFTLATGDFNGDGKIDVALANSGLQAVSLLYGNGDGTFQAAQTVQSSSGVGEQLVAGDFNGDGKLDLFSEPTTSDYLGNLYLQGQFPKLTTAPGSLTFSEQAAGTTSAPQTVVVTNSGAAPMAISGVSITGANSTDYAENSTCTVTLAVNASCQVTVAFMPTAQGTRSAFLSIGDNAPGSPHTISLTGMTTPAPALTLSPSSVTFAGQYVGTSGLPQTITATNTGDAPLTITSVTTSIKDFGVLSACGNSLAAGASCSIGVFFDPESSGTVSGTLTIASNAGISPQSVTLNGMGQAFSFTSPSSTQTVAPGATATYSISVNPIAGFNQTVALTCSGAPAGSTCSLSSNAITLSGSTPVSVTVSVTTVGNSAAAQPQRPLNPGSQIPVFFAICGLPGLLLWGGSRRGSGKQKTAEILGIGLMGIVCLLTAGCGGNKSSSGAGTPASTYTLTVTGTFAAGSANLTQSTNLMLVVQ